MMLPPLRRAIRFATPAAALGCGLVAAGAAGFPSALSVALALAVVMAWQVWREVVAETHWAPALARWRAWRGGTPLPQAPYTEPGSASERLSALGGQFRDFTLRGLWPLHGAALAGAIVALGVSLLLGWALGPFALVLAAIAALSPQAALLSRGGSMARTFAALDTGLVELALPFALGAGLLSTPSATQMALGAAAGLAWAGLRAGPSRWVWQAGNASALAVLVAGRHSLGAFLFALCWLPQLMAGLAGISANAGRWLLAGLLVASIAAQ